FFENMSCKCTTGATLVCWGDLSLHYAPPSRGHIPEKRSLRSANEIVQVGHDNGPSPAAEFLSQRRLGLLPKRQCLAQSRPAFPGNFDGATAAPALVAHPDQTLSFKRSQVSGQG